MNYQTLKTIPELQNKIPEDRNTLVKATYTRDRRLSALNMLHALTAFICVPISIYLTEGILGYRSLLWSIPMYFLLVGLASCVLSRFFIYPRIARTLRSFPPQDTHS